MPAYNANRHISDAIHSVLHQTYSNWELIIVDDGSTDNTSETCRHYQKLDNRIHYYYQENKKQGKARNLGISKSNGDFLAFLDADDLWLPEKLEVSINEFKSGDQDLLFTEAYIFSNKADLDDVSLLRKMGVTSCSYQGKRGIASFLYQNRIPLLTVVVKKEVLLNVGCFNDRGVAEDYELWLNLLASGYTLRGIDNPLSFYREHNFSTTANDKLAVDSVAMMLSDFFEEHKDLKKEYRQPLKTWFKKYLILHKGSSIKELQLPSVFADFRKQFNMFKILLGSKKLLPVRAFDFLLYKVF
jgi:glycosyltransferase involved in cell wall biosynthesis